MTEQQTLLKERLTFNREIIEVDGKPMVKMSTWHNGLYRQMLYVYHKDEDYTEHDEEVKNLIAISMWNGLRTKI